MKVMHMADLHLGSFAGPDTKNGENARFHDLLDTMDALCDQAVSRKPDLIIIAGDLFHQAKVWSDRGLREQTAMVKFLRRLIAVAPVFVLRGTPNHDGAEQFNTLASTFEGDARIVFATQAGVYPELSANSEPICIAAIPGFHRGLFDEQPQPEEDAGAFYTSVVNEAVSVLSHACCGKGKSAILVAHYPVESSKTESGMTGFFGGVDPVISTQALNGSAFDLCCFGHIHRPQKIPGCSRAFYSGAAAQLNFNDEGQERGFYMHTLEKGSLASEFVSLPCRQMQTVDLDDDAISRIIADDFSPIAKFDLHGRIVRVRYSCTDVHNASLRVSAIERYLYGMAGAFWVQEISPVDVRMTSVAEGVRSDLPPLENLASYLSAKGMAPEDISRIVRLAEPIVRAGDCAAEQRYTVGRFVPVSIEVHNYRNYEDESFDYRKIHFCTINGENGSGKSSLFIDAVVDALYEAPREGELDGWISNRPDAKSGFIRFCFRVGEDMFRVQRQRRKSGKAVLKLEQMAAGDWQDISCDKMRDTQAKLEAVIGMDQMTFCSCVLIMQDRYGLFLSADPEERMNVLSGLLGLEAYDAMESEAASAALEAKRSKSALDLQIEQKQSLLSDKNVLLAAQAAAQADIEAWKEKQKAVTAQLGALRNEAAGADSSAQYAKNISQLCEQSKARKAALLQRKALIQQQISSLSKDLSEKEAILSSKKEYDSLCMQEYSILQALAGQEAIKSQLESSRKQCSFIEDQIRQQKALAKAADERITLLSAELLREEEYKAAAQEDEDLARQQKALYEQQQSSESAAASAAACEKQILSAKADFDRRIQSVRSDLSSARRQAEVLSSSGCIDAENAHCLFLKDAQAAKAKIPQLEALAAQLEAEKEKAVLDLSQKLSLYQAGIVPDLAKKAGEIAAKRSTLAVKVQALHSLSGVRQQLADLSREQTQYDEKIHSLGIELCGAQNDVSEFSRGCSDMVRYASDLARVREELAKRKPAFEKAAKLDSMEESLADKNRSLSEILQSIEETDASLAQYSSVMQRFEASKGAENVQDRIREKSKELEQISDSLSKSSAAFGKASQNLEQWERDKQEIDHLIAQRNAYSSLSADYAAIKSAFALEGIRHEIIASTLPSLEQSATAILSQMSGGRMRVEFVTRSELKSNRSKQIPTLDIVIDDTVTGKLPYRSRSGGERVKAALSVALALAEIKSSRAGIQLGFLAIDEPPYLDAAGGQAYCDALIAIRKRYPEMKIMAITHDFSMKGRFPESVEVVKTANGSKIVLN